GGPNTRTGCIRRLSVRPTLSTQLPGVAGRGAVLAPPRSRFPGGEPAHFRTRAPKAVVARPRPRYADQQSGSGAETLFRWDADDALPQSQLGEDGLARSSGPRRGPRPIRRR